ncbi:TetR/AcrR family transcriptional regulator [Streptomyces sp. LX-29]|uniref:TetR/AcrR family transcriptional regulator n=1 Tax=Streptomyces sp. LX-29 TaxID=2900152 RepID=UPI00240D7034|nr:TetR/AcrR family transcriptional regulator [Streptomyces sp. LX-29]WFB07247.1 TetR/AcrR family transcriptional regulator [Streptomyces sp. LX-29]
MGHREDLLQGAKRCLLEKGWSRTTARDIVAASGANLASIGYHYGSKDALMREALFSAMGDWGDELAAMLKDEVPGDATSLERFASSWTRVRALFDRHRGLWMAQLEAILQAERDPELRAAFGRAQPEGREGLVALFHGIDDSEVDSDSAKILGSFYMTLVSGMVVQMALDDELTPGGEQLAEAMRRLVTGE